MYLCPLPYSANGAAVFAHFAQRPYAMFLDSCGVGRFDIIVADPSHVVTAASAMDDAFTQAKNLFQPPAKLSAKNIPDELPFTIGVIGYFNYDLGYRLAELNSKAVTDIGLPSAVAGYYDWSIVIDHAEHAAYLISRENPNSPALREIQELLLQPAAAVGHFNLTQNFLPNMNKIQYAAAFDRVQQHIHAGDCYQINLAQRFSGNYIGSPWVAYQRLRSQVPMPMAAYINLPEGAILSLSPERFLQVNDREVLTQPIKGTSPRFADAEQDRRSAESLLASEKDRAENIMIVDLLRNDLGKCCRSGSIRVPKLCALESFANVHHLVSSVTGVLAEDQHPFDLLRHCFPGGSITGAPKRRAMEIIDHLEPHHRSLYCGSIAYCDERGRMDSNIAIRTLLCHDQKIHCYGGGGIVSDSKMESEYQEIQAKISRLLNVLENP